MLYLASVARPMIHGPGSSIYILASREWTAGRQIPFQPRNSTRYLTVETAICDQQIQSDWNNSVTQEKLTPSIVGYLE